MFILYDLVFLILSLVYFPVYLFKGKFHQDFSRRIGILPKNLNLNQPIWIHAVSVGEAASIRGLVTDLRKAYPQKKIVISTVTATGNKIAQSLAKEGDFLTYLPLDFSFIVRGVLKKINPCMFIIAETEIWPNLISCLYKMKIPIVTVNGRISDGSYEGYRRIKLFIRPILRKINKFCVQSATDAKRLEDLGVEKKNIQVTGNVKFDINLEAASKIDAAMYRKKLWLASDEKLLVCGSTHMPEEEIIINAYKEILVSYPKLKLLIAPRHPQNAAGIFRILTNAGFVPILISTISESCPTCINKAVFILDVMGELSNYYAAADIVFVGGSLVNKGGHNIIEPASFKKPVIFGPNMSNFRDIAKVFLDDKAAFMVEGLPQFVAKVKEILNNANLIKQLSENASQLILKNRGATLKNIQIIREVGDKYGR